MSLNPAKCRVEIFREPGFFDDNWQKGWSIVSGGTSGWDIQDGEKVILNAGDQTYGFIEHSLNNINSDIYTKLEVRVLFNRFLERLRLRWHWMDSCLEHKPKCSWTLRSNFACRKNINSNQNVFSWSGFRNAFRLCCNLQEWRSHSRFRRFS